MAFAKHSKHIRLIDSDSKVRVLGSLILITKKKKTLAIPRKHVIDNGKSWVRIHKDVAQELGLM